MTWRRSWPTWRRGAWSLSRRDDEIADIAFDGTVVVRSIRAVVRDRDWNTATVHVDGVREEDDALTMTVRVEGYGADQSGTVRVAVSDDTLSVELTLTTAEEYWTNRTGLVLLHPPVLAGTALEVTHSDGTTEHSRFPEAISAHQPVVDIAALSWRAGALAVSVELDGDVFEMEDQRNWTDASYKTYSRPLALPFPYRLAPAETVRQRITVAAAHAAAPAPRAPAAEDVIALTCAAPFPGLALGAATGPGPAPLESAPVGDAVLVELDLGSTTWLAALERAGEADLPLDVRVVLAPESTHVPDELAAALRAVPLARVGVFHSTGAARHVTDSAALDALRHALATAGVTAEVVAGSRSHFTELNRERHRIPDGVDGIAVSLTPLFHSLGTEQLVESLAMQRLVATESVAFAAGRPVHIGPVCLRPRFNDVATARQPGPTRADLAEGYGAQFTGAVDERQRSSELAAWTIASAAALAVPGVASLTYFEQWGPRGIRAASGEAYPVAAALAAIDGLRGGLLLSGDSPDGLIWAVGSRRDEGDRVLVANLDERAREVRIVVAGTSADVLLPAGRWQALG